VKNFIENHMMYQKGKGIFISMINWLY